MSAIITPNSEGRMCEYLLMLSPSDEVKEETMRIKRIFKEQYNCWYAVSSYPHFTLAYSFLNENEEEKFIKNLEDVAAKIQPFLVELYKFDRFSSSTIFIDMINKDPFINIGKLVKEKAGYMMKTYKKDKPEFIKNPHLTVARGMRKDQFEQAWAEWESVEINYHFDATEMVLLKKPEGGRKYETIKTIPFSGTASAGFIQGSLF